MIDFGEPWNSDINRPVWEHRPSVYGGLGCAAPLTNVMAIVGADTIWPTTGRRQYSEITTGTSYTVAAILPKDTSINWVQPVDGDVATTISDYQNNGELLAVFVDGHVESVRDVDADRLRELSCI